MYSNLRFTKNVSSYMNVKKVPAGAGIPLRTADTIINLYKRLFSISSFISPAPSRHPPEAPAPRREHPFPVRIHS